MADDEESRIALKMLRARFLSRDCGIGMTAYEGYHTDSKGEGRESSSLTPET